MGSINCSRQIFNETMKYKDALEELQQIVQALQEGELSVDELTVKVKRAAELVAFCQDKLRNTENEIQSLFKDLE